MGALISSAITIIYFGIYWIGILALVWAGLKLTFNRHWKYLCYAILLCLVMAMRCQFDQKALENQEVINNHRSFILIVEPDQFKINDNFLSGQGWVQNNEQTIRFYGSISKEQLAQFDGLSFKTLKLVVTADVEAIEHATNFNQFDLANYYRTQGITHALKLRTVDSIYIETKVSIVHLLHQIRAKWIDYAERLPHPLNLYFASLLLGVNDHSLMDEINGLKQLGLIHLFSISGFHVYFLINILMWGFSALRVRKEVILIILIVCLPLYFIFAGSSIGLLRAILTAEIAMVASLFSYRYQRLNVWGIVLIINLLIAPESLLQLGCQLSYILSFGLLFTSQDHFWRQTLLMNLLSVPIVIYHLYEWHLLSLAANWFILPLFSVLIIPLIILGGITFQILPSLSFVIAWCLKQFDELMNFISTLPGNLLFGKPPWWLVLIALIITLKLFDGLRKRMIVSLGLVYMAIFLVVHLPFDGEISYFDVGQGDSFLIREPFNRSVTMIDTGGKVSFGSRPKNQHYQAEQTSINYLKSRGINQIDNLCISHQDADHCGDLPAFLRSMKVKIIYIPWGMQNNDSFMNKLSVSSSKVQLIPVRAGNQIAQEPLVVYHPFKSGLGKNEDSMVLGANINRINWTFTGDLDQNGELEILNHFPRFRTDVLKLGHHGSKTSSAPQFLDQLRPRIVIISAGRNNRYHHPNQETLVNVSQRQLKVYNTQVDGMITYHYWNNGSGYFETMLRGIH